MDQPDESQPLLFEVAWEVCWQLGGIYTVMRSKAANMVSAWADRYCLVGPYNADTSAVEFEAAAPPPHLAETMRRLGELNVRAHFGHWLVAGRPQVILLDYQAAFARLGEFKYLLWTDHHIQSPDQDGDMNNVIAFGFVTGMFLQELAKVIAGTRPIIAHFHEWMAGLGLMRVRYLKLPVATVFTTHATLLGRYLCTDNSDFYAKIDLINPDHVAGQYAIYPRYCVERGAAHCADAFTTVSDVTALEAEKMLGRKPDVITPNGLNIQKFSALHEFQNLHKEYKEAIHTFVAGHFFGIGMLGQLQAAGDPAHVRIHHDAASFVKGVAKHDIGGLAAHAAQTRQFFHRLRHLPVIAGDDIPGGLLNGAGLAAEKTGALNDLFDFGRLGFGQGPGIREPGEKLRRNHVHADIGALR